MADEKYRIEGNTLIINDGVTAIEGADFHTYYEDNGYENVKDEKFQNVKKVVLPDSVTEIDYDAFYDFQSLKDISLPNSITNIGNYAFADCSNLESVIIPDSVTSIDWYAFMNCISLKSITIPNSVTSIDEFAFWGCENLTIVCNKGSYAEEFAAEKGIPVEYIDEKKYHIEGDTLVINDGVTTIDETDFRYNDDDGEPYTFDEIKNIQHIIIPNSVKRIDNNAFHDCRELISITIPDSVTYIADNAFNEWTEFTIVCNEGSYAAKYAEENDISVDLINERIYHIEGDTLIIDKGYEEIDERDFGWHKGLYWQAKKELEKIKKIIIPDGVRIIDTAAFSGFTNLTDISIPDTVKVIGDEVFNYCESLTNIVLPDTIKEISGYAFCNCKNLKSIALPNNITYIGEKTFENCKSLKSITIPDSVTNIYEDAFRHCESLTSIVIPNGVKIIDASAFENCKNLKSITIPDSVISICEDAFLGCESLENITILNSVTGIGRRAFGGCKNLTIRCNKGSCAEEYAKENDIPVEYIDEKKYHIESNTLVINDGVTTIEKTNFHTYDEDDRYEGVKDKKFQNVKKVVLPNSVTEIGEDAFYDFTSLEDITIPNSVTSIDKWAFMNCKNLKNITIPSSVTSIGYAAFESCKSLTNITIPESITKIENWAFGGCTSLTSITIPDGVTSIDEDAFRDCENFTIKCNKGSYAEKYAKWCNIPIEYIGEHTKEQALSQIKDYINTLAEAMKHYDGKGDVGTYLEGYVGSSGADLGAFLSETSAAYIRNCFVSAYSGVNFNNTKDKSPIERYEARISSAARQATSLAEELVNKSEKTSVEEIVDDVMHNEDFKKILKKELKAKIPENHKDDIISGKINEQDGNEIIGTDINTDYPVKEDCAVYIRDIKDTILENGAGTLTLDDFGDKHYNVQIESDSEIYTFKVSLPVSKTVGGVKVQGFKELGYIDAGKDEVGKTLKEIAENTAVVTSRKNGSKSLNEIFKDNKGKTLD